MGGGVAAAGQVVKRIPSIKFPHRHPKTHAQAASLSGNLQQKSIPRSDVSAAPSNTDVGGKASLQPKRTPVSEREIEAILLGGASEF